MCLGWCVYLSVPVSLSGFIRIESFAFLHLLIYLGDLSISGMWVSFNLFFWC